MRRPWFAEHLTKLVRVEVRAELRRILGAVEPPVRRKRRRKRKTLAAIRREPARPLKAVVRDLHKRKSPPTPAKSRAALRGSARQAEG